MRGGGAISVRTSGLGGGASTRGHVGTVLEVLAYPPISIFSLKPPATSGFAARTVDAKPYSVVSHSSRISTRIRARFHAMFVAIQIWFTALGNGEGQTEPLWVGCGLSKLLFVTETAS
jgi:hypothetical protein